MQPWAHLSNSYSCKANTALYGALQVLELCGRLPPLRPSQGLLPPCALLRDRQDRSTLTDSAPRWPTGTKGVTFVRHAKQLSRVAATWKAMLTRAGQPAKIHNHPSTNPCQTLPLIESTTYQVHGAPQGVYGSPRQRETLRHSHLRALIPAGKGSTLFPCLRAGQGRGIVVPPLFVCRLCSWVSCDPASLQAGQKICHPDSASSKRIAAVIHDSPLQGLVICGLQASWVCS